MKDSYDAVVIGSGFGGAITAYRLAQAGRSVAILEQGRRWQKEEYPRTVGQTSQAAFWQEMTRETTREQTKDRTNGFLEYRAFKNIDVIQGVGVGGGSLHYFNVNLRAPARVLDRWPAPLTRARLDPYYALAEENLESRPLAPPALRVLPPRTQAFMAAAQASGGQPQLTPIAVYTGPERTNRGGVTQSACVYCGNCMLGCHVHAKNSLDITYIAAAERRYGVEMYPLHKVEGIRPSTEKGAAYQVDFRVLAGRGGATGERGSLYAQKVIVAAGALGSTELLLRCRDQLRTLPRLSATLGTRFSGNGDMLFAGAWRTKEAIDPAQGPSITAVVDCSTEDHAIHVEDLGFPDPMFWMLEGVLPPGLGGLRQALGLLGRYLARSLGMGGRTSRVTDQLGAFLGGGRANHFLPYLGMGTDAADGELRLRDGALDVVWSHRKSRSMFRQMEKAMRRISAQTGGEYVASFLWRWPSRKLLTAHPLGGAVIGGDEHTGVVNHAGEVWNYPGLYVTDGASIPSALSVNPSLTIAAIAERAAFWMLHGRERVASDPDGA